MTDKSNTSGISWMLRGLDFCLLLIVLTSGTVGLEWMASKSQATVRENVAPPASLETMTQQIAALQKEIEDLSRERHQKQKEADRIRKELDEAKANLPNLDDAQAKRIQTQQDLEKLQEDIKRLRKQLEQLQQQERDLQQEKKHSEQLRKAIAEINRKIEQLGRQLAQLKDANQNAEGALAELQQLPPVQRPKIVVDFYPRFTPRNSSNAVCVKLTKDTVAPVREPYYTFTEVSNGTRVTPARPGEAIGRALAAGSDFQNLLDEIARKRQYVFFLVDSSAFETFRTVRETLRQRNIPFGWDPTDVTAFTFVASGGTQPGTIE